MPYDDDKFGRIWPTRQGGAIGGARERQMLDALGGSEGFRTRISYNADGSVTELRTKDGMPQFTTTKRKIPAAIVTVNSVFFCTPSSTIYQSGYTPSGAPGPVSRWMDWDTATAIPNAHGGASPVLTAFAAYEAGTGGAAKVSPGSITWHGNVKDAADTPIVISWHGGGIRAGRYDKVLVSGGSRIKTRSKISQWNYFPSCTPGFQLKSEVPSDASPASMETYPWVWIGGKARIKVQSSGSDLPVYSAGLRASGAAVELVVISGDSVYAGTIDLLSAGALNTALDGTTVEVAFVCNIPLSATYSLLQWPFMNASATKAAYLVDTYTTSSGSLTPLYEVDLAAGSSSVIATAENKEVYQEAYTTVATNSSSSSIAPYDPNHAEIHSSINFSGEQHSVARTYSNVLAADYVGDTLVYLAATASVVGRGFTSNNTRTYDFLRTSSGSTFNWSASVNASFSNGAIGGVLEAKLTHSLYGEVFSETYGGAAGPAYSASGTYSGSGSGTSGSDALNAPFTTSMSEDTASGEISMRVYNADLRVNSYLIAVAGNFTRTINTRLCSGYWRMNDVQYGSSSYFMLESDVRTSQVSFRYPLRVVAKVDGQDIFDVTGSIFEETIPAVENWSDGTVPHQSYDVGFNTQPFAASASIPPAVTYATETPFAYTPYLTATAEYCPKAAHLAVSNDKKGAYAGYVGEPGLYTRPTNMEGFRMNAIVGIVPANRYCPGSDDTLASPVFFPAY